MFDKIYVKNADGSVTAWEQDIFNNPRKAFSQRVPREVSDAFEYYGVTRVVYDGFDCKPDMTASAARLPVQTESAEEVAAVAGSFLGSLLRRL